MNKFGINNLYYSVNSIKNIFYEIVGETIIDIYHTLVSKCNKIEDIKIIYSKDIAFDQCSIFLENFHLSEVKYEYVDSTTKAAILASQMPNSAAICSNLAAKISNIPILFNNIKDNKNNKTSIIAQLPNRYGSLNDFKKNKINLIKLNHIL